MNISTVMTELLAATATVDGVRAHEFISDRVVPPAAIPGWPLAGTFHSTYARGADEMTFPIILLVGKAEPRTASHALAQYASGSGPKSILTAIENYDTTAWDVATVRSWEADVVSLAGVAYLACEFTVHIIGSGS